MGALDKKAAEEFYLPVAVLMENAGRAVAESAAELLDGDVYAKNVVIFVGKGNNGGDGLVAARWLSAEGARVKVFVASPASDFSGAAAVQLKICAKSGLAVNVLQEETDWNIAEIAAAHADLLIDALLGTGFKGELGGSYKRACVLMNSVRANVLAVDVPSGAEADTEPTAELYQRTDRTVGEIEKQHETIGCELDTVGAELDSAGATVDRVDDLIDRSQERVAENANSLAECQRIVDQCRKIVDDCQRIIEEVEKADRSGAGSGG